MRRTERQSPCLSPDRARDLVVELERHGLDAGRIEVVAAPARSVEATSRVDRASFTRPLMRSAIGAVIGVVVGALLGGLLVTATDSLPTGTVLGTVVAGAVLGGLYGLYIRLPVNTDVVDVDAGRDSIVRVDVAGLDDDDIGQVEQLISNA